MKSQYRLFFRPDIDLTLKADITAMGFNHDDIATSQSLLTPSTTLVSVAGFAVAGWLSWHFRRRWPLLGFATLWFLVGHMLEAVLLENPESKPALQALYDIQRGSGRVGDAQETARRLMMVDPDRRFTRRLLLRAGS